jgi:predicted NACHT family NTPase
VSPTAARAQRKLSLELPEERLAEILSLGRALVIFDGLAEIPELLDREEFVRRVEAFGRRFPLAGILVTSRRRGYGYTPLDPDSFTAYELREFTDDTVPCLPDRERPLLSAVRAPPGTGRHGAAGHPA